MYIPVPGSICFCSHCSYSECYKNLQVVPIDTWEDRGKSNKAKQPWAIVVNMSFLQHSVSWDGNQTSPAPQVKIPRLFQLYTISNKFVSQFSQHCLGRCLISGHFPLFTKAPSFSISLDFLSDNLPFLPLVGTLGVPSKQQAAYLYINQSQSW